MTTAKLKTFADLKPMVEDHKTRALDARKAVEPDASEYNQDPPIALEPLAAEFEPGHSRIFDVADIRDRLNSARTFHEAVVASGQPGMGPSFHFLALFDAVELMLFGAPDTVTVKGPPVPVKKTLADL